MSAAPRVLVVADDERVLRVRGDDLLRDGYEVAVACTARTARVQLGRGPEAGLLCDLAVSWVALLLRALRGGEVAGADACLPVLAVCPDEEAEIVRCLAAGADCVVPSNASALRVAAELQALLRRCCHRALMRRGALQVGNVRIDRDARLVEVAGQRVHLTPIEFGVLEVLALGSNRAIERALLVNRVWGGIASSACVRVHIARLRRVLGDAGATVVVETRYGIGWRLAVEGECKERAKATPPRRKDSAEDGRKSDRALRLAG